jgi:hypothetical protein
MTRTHPRFLAVCLLTAAAAVLIPLSLSRGEAVPAAGQVPPTVPCPGCGPGSTVPGPKPFAFAYPEHFCPPELQGASRYTLRYGLGAQAVTAATFFVSINGGAPVRLETLQPGESAVSPPITVQPGETFTVRTWATVNGKPGGPRVLFGNGAQGREDTLVCDCPPPGVDTTSSTVPGSTVPGSSTVPPPVVSVTVNTVPPAGFPPDATLTPTV